MTFKEKYYSIDQTKLPEKAKVYMEEFKKDTKNFTDKEAMKIIMPTLDGFIKKLKESGYESAIKTSQTEKPTKEKVVKKKTAKEMVKEIVEEAVEQPKTTKGQPKMRTIKQGDYMRVAKEIRKEGEPWKDALKRAKEFITTQKEVKKEEAKRQYQKLKEFIQKQPEYYPKDIPTPSGGRRGTTLQRDAVRVALPKGKRISKETGKAYYEYRSNRIDKRRDDYPFLAKGGEIPQDKSLKYFIMNEASSGSIANKTPYSSYKDIDGVRWAASQILMRDGDREYSLQAYTDLIKQAVEEYEENKYEMSFADGGEIVRNKSKNDWNSKLDFFFKYNYTPVGKGALIQMAYDDTKGVDSAIPQSLWGEVDNTMYYVYDYNDNKFGELVDLREKLKFSNTKVDVTIVKDGNLLYKNNLPEELKNATFHQALDYVFKNDDVTDFSIKPKGQYAKGGELDINKYAGAGMFADGGSVKYPTDLKIGSVLEAIGFPMLKGIDGGSFYTIVEMDNISATLVKCDKNGNRKGTKKVRHYLDSIEGKIKTASRGDENGLLVVKYADGGELDINKYAGAGMFARGGYVDSNTLPMGVDSFVYFNTEEDGKIIWNIISATNDDAKSKKARNFLAKNQGEKITLKDGTQIKIDSYGQSSRFMLERDLKSNNGIVRVWNEFKPKYWSTDGGEEDLKKRAEKYSIKLAKAYRMYWLSDAYDREGRRFDKLVEESQIPEEQLDRIKEYARETPIKDQRPNEIYKLLYADGGMTKRMIALPVGTREQIEESIRMGYDTLVEGMISPKTRGVMLIDKESNVRGTYPMLYKGAIEEILHNIKGYAKGGYTATGEDYEYINTFGVAQNDFDEMVEAWHKTDSHDQMDRIESRLTFRRMINKYGEEKVESINKYIWDTHNAHEHSGEYAKGGAFGMGGKVIDFYSEIGSNDLKEELSEKIKKGDDVIHFAFTDYGGSFMDKVAIEYFEENYPDNIVVENTAYSGKNAFVFGQPATEWLESTQDYPLGFEDFEDYYYQRQNDVEYDGFKYFVKDLERDYSFDEQEVLDWLMENKSGYYSVDTQGIDFSYEQLTEELEGEGLIKKSEEFAKGGKIGFKGLSKKVAKYYTNKKVPSEYQNLYGKTYDKKEAKEVGDKVASKVYRLQLSKMAKGGEVSANEHFRSRGIEFLRDDLETLEQAIQDNNSEEIQKFFSYWGQHLNMLETDSNERMYNFLKDDMAQLEKAIEENNQEEIDKFFSYWNYHLSSLKMAKGGEVGTYIMTDDTYVNIFLSKGFVEKRGSMGLRFFEHKPTGIYITYDQKGYQIPVIITKDKSGEETIYEGNSIREVKDTLDKLGIKTIKEGIDNSMFAKGGEVGNTTHEKVTLIFDGKEHKYDMVFVDGVLEDILLPYSSMNTPLFDYLEKEFDDWMENVGGEYEAMYFSDEAIYSKRGAIRGAMDIIEETISEDKGKKKVYNLDKGEVDIMSAFS